ncbi:MAG: D-glycero-alpha-D-manno-heptose-1,7-bisphosphate 7-phosphatase [Chthoniobacterales bacterium]
MTTPPGPKSPAVFLDRDGTLMHDVDYCGSPKDVHVFAGATEALRRLKMRGYKLVVITNQSGIGRGYFDEHQYRMVEREFNRQIGIDVIDATYHCPHSPNENCKCRKPAPDLVVRAARDLQLDLRHSFFVGDKKTDIECGRNAGVKTILIRTGYGKQTPAAIADFVANNLQELADLIPLPNK